MVGLLNSNIVFLLSCSTSLGYWGFVSNICSSNDWFHN